MAKELNKTQAKAHKRKITILAVMVLATGATWSKNLFGKGDKSATTAVPGATTAASNAALAPAASTAAGSPAANSSSITNYDQAVARMGLWPLALDRQVHVGTIEELTPINDLLGDGEVEVREPDPEVESLLAPILQPALPPIVEDPDFAFEDLRLKLTTTARFGKSTMAIINGEKVREGESVQVQVDGETIRYEVRAIGTRMVEVAYGGNVHVLRIDHPDIQRRDLEGA
ncbi:MAG: hypothetical protein ACYSU1_04235, partial [Planctomycetota bacterium]